MERRQREGKYGKEQEITRWCGQKKKKDKKEDVREKWEDGMKKKKIRQSKNLLLGKEKERL